MKKIISLFLAVFLICSLAVSVQASEIGSIEVKVQYNGEKITGGQLIAVRIAYVDREDMSFKQVTDDKIVQDIGKSSAVTAMVKYYQDNADRSEFTVLKKNVKNGVAKFENLTTGLYLIYQEKAAPGYSKLASFLVTVPYTVDGNEIFDVTIDSKSELERNPSTTPTTPPETTPPDEKLPQTSQLKWPVPVMAASGIALFLFGWMLTLTSRKDAYET